MSLLWAPWRKAYLRSSLIKSRGCLFCRIFREKKDKKNLVVFRTAHYAVVLNRYPYTNGHVLIVPRRHIADLSQLNSSERAEFFDVLCLTRDAIEEFMKPHGFNIGMNLADIAGAGIPDHLHWHVVPRWKGDVNFMPVIAGAKIISESLESAYEGLSRAMKRRKSR